MEKGEKNTTGVLIFVKTTLPENAKIDYEIFNVRPFISNPLRGSKYKIYGHSNQAYMISNHACDRCALVGHNELCSSAAVCCFHSKGAHSISSRNCHKWKEEKVWVVKATQGITYFDARKKARREGVACNPYAEPILCIWGYVTANDVLSGDSDWPAKCAWQKHWTYNSCTANPTSITQAPCS